MSYCLSKEKRAILAEVHMIACENTLKNKVQELEEKFASKEINWQSQTINQLLKDINVLEEELWNRKILLAHIVNENCEL